MTALVTDNEFVGREQELAFLMGRFLDAKNGRGGLVAVTGDYGIGKTRLLNEFGEVIRHSGDLFASGSCLEYLQSLKE